MREDFVAFILTHGRPDRVSTIASMKRSGYTGRTFLVVDDEDASLPAYVAKFGADRVLVFSKAEIAKTFDEADNFEDRRAIVYARNACWKFAEQVGAKFFIQLDDDYQAWGIRVGKDNSYGWWPVSASRSLDHIFEAMLEFYEAIPALSVAMSQGGDHIGGVDSTHNRTVMALRKAMNTFICSVDRPFTFTGRVNEDVNTYVSLGRRGALFLTLMQVQIVQHQTQTAEGGMSDLYRQNGTYVKSFYTVMHEPSCCKVGTMGNTYGRLHHHIDWPTAVPRIVREEHRKRSQPSG